MLSAAISRCLITVRDSARQRLLRENLLPGPGSFTRRVILLAGGTALGQGVTILAAPILTRLYGPADFGMLAVYASILTTVLGVAALRYQLALPIASDDETTVNLLGLCLIVVGGMTVLLAGALWWQGDALVTWTQSQALAAYLWLLPMSFFGAGSYQVLTAWAIRKNHFGPLARTRFGQGVGIVITQLGLGIIRIGPAGLLIGDAIGRASGSLSLARLVWQEHRGNRRAVSLGRMREIAARYRRFPLISGPSSLLANLRDQLPTLLLASFFGGLVVGWFGLAQRLLTVTFYLIASSIGDVYLNESARLAREDPTKMMPFYWRTLRRVVVVALPLLSVLALLGPWAFGLVFGEEWVESGRYIRVLVIVSMFDLLARSVSSTLNVLERQDLDLVVDVLGIVLIGGALILGGRLSADPFTTLQFYAVGGSLNGICNLAFVWYAIRRETSRAITHQPPTGAGA